MGFVGFIAILLAIGTVPLLFGNLLTGLLVSDGKIASFITEHMPFIMGNEDIVCGVMGFLLGLPFLIWALVKMLKDAQSGRGDLDRIGESVVNMVGYGIVGNMILLGLFFLSS